MYDNYLKNQNGKTFAIKKITLRLWKIVIRLILKKSIWLMVIKVVKNNGKQTKTNIIIVLIINHNGDETTKFKLSYSSLRI